MSRTVIKNGNIITLDPAIGNLSTGDLIIEDDQIREIGQNLDISDADVINASGMIVIPGFVNSHIHLWQTGLRGIAGDWTLMDYFHNILSNIGAFYRPEDVYISNLIGALEQLNAGVTTVLDWCNVVNSPDHAASAISALTETGIRAVFAYGPPGVFEREQRSGSTLKHPEDLRLLRTSQLTSNDARITLAIAIHGPNFSSDETTAYDIHLARELGILATMHIGAGSYGTEDRGVCRLATADLLGSDINCVHANMLSQYEYQLLAQNGCSVSVTPEVEMQMGHGLPATGKLLDAGVRPALGVDITSNVSGDMFTQMRIALQMQRALDNACLLEKGETIETVSITTRQALEFATIDSARALGLSDKVGTLTPGKQADIIMLRTNDINLFPVQDAIQAVVLQAYPANVDTVLVAGYPVKRQGKLLHPGLAQLQDRLAQSSNRVLYEAKLLSAK